MYLVLEKEKLVIGSTEVLNLAAGWTMNVQLTNCRLKVVT
jgi:hypothetical protein